MSTPQFSVICAAYNTGHLIESTLRSLQAQTVPDFEVIVVDDGSTDDTASRVAAFAERDARIRLFQQANAKPAAARNRALEEARGRWISIIDSDDLWLPNYLETVGSALRSAPQAGICFCDMWMLDDVTRLFEHQTFKRLEYSMLLGRRVIPAAQLERRLMLDNVLPASATTVTRQALDVTGGFDTSPSLFGAEDWDLWLRIVQAGFAAVKVPDAVAIWRDRAGSETKKSLMMATGSDAAVRSALQRNPDDPEIARLARLKISQTERNVAEQRGARFPDRIRAETLRALKSIKRRALRNREWREPPDEIARYLDLVDPQPGSPAP